jgi:CO dehydrogenase maturation factor
MKPLIGKRILVCGKGGSGKSSIVTLMAQVCRSKDYPVLLIDGDASNPGGLIRLITGNSASPKPLIEYFGGREKVLCPVDDPSPLTRMNDSRSLIDQKISLGEIPKEYYIRKNDITLFQVGKIQTAYEGCDGPMSKITRDFIVQGDHVTLIDVEAGVEHFGRGIERYIDIVLIVVNPVFESFDVARRVYELSKSMGIVHTFTILNSVHDSETEKRMRMHLSGDGICIVGSVPYDNEIFTSGMEEQNSVTALLSMKSTT